MKIAQGTVSMASSRDYSAQISARATTWEGLLNGPKAVSSVTTDFESFGSSLSFTADEYQKQKTEREAAEHHTQGPSGYGQASGPLQLMIQARTDENVDSLVEEIKTQLLNQLLWHLDRMNHAGHIRYGNAPAVGTTANGTVWQRVTETSATFSETERTTFQSQGIAVTEDGRTLNFDVEITMSRSFTERYTDIATENYILTDPLIINLDSNDTSISDRKFRFDLDGDGEAEEISFAGKGSGFLALDVNGNGTIDDGSELFGTKSGDGFADLAAYDEDGNHWIDENDSIYSQLRVWTRNAFGQDKLLTLKEADVGAVYLGSISTEFSLNDAETNRTDGIVRKTGVYLKESGGVGTLSHVDLRAEAAYHTDMRQIAG